MAYISSILMPCCRKKNYFSSRGNLDSEAFLQGLTFRYCFCKLLVNIFILIKTFLSLFTRDLISIWGTIESKNRVTLSGAFLASIAGKTRPQNRLCFSCLECLQEINVYKYSILDTGGIELLYQGILSRKSRVIRPFTQCLCNHEVKNVWNRPI